MGSKKRRRNPSEETSAAAVDSVRGDASSNSAASGLMHWWRVLRREPIAIGLGVVLAYRPWVDGITFPVFNIWFTAFILILTVSWGIRILLRGDPLRCVVPSGLLFGFLLIATVTGFSSIQPDSTYRSLLLWTSYLCLFLLCVNTLRTRASIGIILCAFVVSGMVNALWAIRHVDYVLPALRLLIEEQPQIIAQYFPTPVITPELHNRLMSNRAFGTFLFSNALASFLIMGIPYIAGSFRVAFADWRTATKNRLGEARSKALSAGQLNESAVVGISAWALAALAAWYVYPIDYSVTHPGDTTSGPLAPALIFIGLVPLLVGMFCLVVTRWNGSAFLFLTLKTMTLPLALVFQVYALYSTYSRGGMLGLALGTALAAVLFLSSGSGRGIKSKLVRTATAGALLAAMLGSFMIPSTSAQQAPAIGSNNPAEVSSPMQAKAPARKSPRDLTLRAGGNKVELGQMGDASTIRLRLRYWAVSWRMIKEYFWTGTGLGNYQVAYLNHQYLGDPDVKMAHNDYIQLFCETGVFGFLAFCGFWIYFVVWGAFRILHEKIVSERWILCGLYAGIVAFLFHALVDFNFINPSMAMTVFCLAGVFYARAYPMDRVAEQAPARSSYAQVVALPLLFVTIFAGYQTYRIGQFEWRLMEGDANHKFKFIGSREGIHARAATSKFFLQDLGRNKFDPNNPPYISYAAALQLMRSREAIESFGHLRVIVPGSNSIRLLEPDEMPPPATYVFIREEHFGQAKKEAAEATSRWLNRVGEIDLDYAHDPELANYLSTNYTQLRALVSNPQMQTSYAKAAWDWAAQAVQRSPKNSMYRTTLGQSIWAFAKFNPPPRSIELYYKGLSAYIEAAHLYPSSEVVWRRYAKALEELVKLNGNMRSTPQGKSIMNSLGITGDDSIMRQGIVDTRERANRIRRTRMEWETGQ